MGGAMSPVLQALLLTVGLFLVSSPGLAVELKSSTIVKFSWSDCSKMGDPVRVQNLTITPNPSPLGKEVLFVLDFELSEVVTGGKIVIVFSWEGIELMNKTLELCATVEEIIGANCPLYPGVFTASVTETLPAFAPGGRYSYNFEVTDRSRRELTCVELITTV